MDFNKVDPTINELNIPEQLENQVSQPVSDEEISIDFVDDNNIIEKSDILYSSDKAKSLAQPYLKFLDRYDDGIHSWTQALKDMVMNIIHVFNEGNKKPENWEQKPRSTVMYSKDNKLLSTHLKRADGETEDVNYVYRSDGSVDTVNYKDTRIIDYRNDGTRFSYRTTDINAPEINISYDTEGKISSKSEFDYDNNRYKEVKINNGRVIELYEKDSNSAKRTIYKEGVPVLFTKYDSKGIVKSYQDKYFGDKLYGESPMDGKIEYPVRQGTSGTCYIAGIVNSMTFIPKGKELLDCIIENDSFGDTVNLPGLKRRYFIGTDYVSQNMSRLGRRDGDYPALVRAFEEFRSEDWTQEDIDNLPKDFFHRDRYYGRSVDSGYPTEVFYALTGKEMKQSGKRITDKDILQARKCLETGNGVVNAGTIENETNNMEIPLEDKNQGITPKHNLSVKKITDRYVIMYDAVTENTINYPIDKFKKYFSKIYYATLD